MWFHLLVGTEGRCVFADSREDPSWSTSEKTLPGDRATVLERVGAGLWKPGQTNKGLREMEEPLQPRWVSPQTWPPLPGCTGWLWGEGSYRTGLLKAGGLSPGQAPRPLSFQKSGDADFGTLP